MTHEARPAKRGAAPLRAVAFATIAAVAAMGVTWWASRPSRMPTEDEQLAAFRDGIEYAGYRATSTAALPLLMPGDVAFPVLQRWAGVAPGPAEGASTPRQTCIARTALAFHALGDGRNAAALAEADLVLAAPGCGNLEQHLAAGVQAVVFDRQRWPGLAARQVRHLALTSSATGVGDARTEVVGLHAALAVLALREERPRDFSLHAGAAALIGGLPWLDGVTAVAVAAERGHRQATQAGLRGLAADPSVPEDVRDEAAALAAGLAAAEPAVALDEVAERLMAQVLCSLTKREAGEAWDELLRRAGEFDPAAWLGGVAPQP